MIDQTKFGVLIGLEQNGARRTWRRFESADTLPTNTIVTSNTMQLVNTDIKQLTTKLCPGRGIRHNNYSGQRWNLARRRPPKNCGHVICRTNNSFDAAYFVGTPTPNELPLDRRHVSEKTLLPEDTHCQGQSAAAAGTIHETERCR